MRNHIGKKCDGKKCFQCHKAHNTLLHLKINKTESNDTSEQYEEKSEESPTASNVSVSAHASAISYRQVLLSTAIINVYNTDGKPVRCRLPKHVSELIKLFESKHYDLAPKRRQNTVVVSDGGPYAPSDVTGTWIPIQSCGDGSRVKKKVENAWRIIMPGAESVKKLIVRFGGSTMPATTTDR